MTILQSAYNAYLTKKYEKDINEFKELALTVIKDAEKKLKDELYLCAVLSDNKREVDKVSKDLLNLIEIERLINNHTLNIEGRLLNNRYIDTLGNEYQKLNNLIVKGETECIDYKSNETFIKNKLEENPNLNISESVTIHTWRMVHGNNIEEYLKLYDSDSKHEINLNTDSMSALRDYLNRKSNQLIENGESVQFANLDEIISKSIERMMEKLN